MTTYSSLLAETAGYGDTLRTGDYAVVLGTSAQSIRRLADQGALPCRRTPGNQRRFPRALVEQVALELEGQETLPMEAPA